MTREVSEVVDVFKQRERDYLLSKARVKVTTSLENLDAGDYRIESIRAGESIELPRWMAEELLTLKLAETDEEPFEAEMFKALSREKMMGPLQLSGLPQDFYLKMKRRLSYLTEMLSEGRGNKEDLEKLRGGGYDLIGMRLGKLLSISSSSAQGSSLTEKLTPEEEAFFSVAQSLSKEWRAALLGSAT